MKRTGKWGCKSAGEATPNTSEQAMLACEKPQFRPPLIVKPVL
jgi:hypothetical protein